MSLFGSERHRDPQYRTYLWNNNVVGSYRVRNALPLSPDLSSLRHPDGRIPLFESVALFVIADLAHGTRVPVSIKPVALLAAMLADLDCFAVSGSAATTTQSVTFFDSMCWVLNLHTTNTLPKPNRSVSFVTADVSNRGQIRDGDPSQIFHIFSRKKSGGRCAGTAQSQFHRITV